MAILKKSEISKMTHTELEGKLFELRRELNSERGLAASGGRSQNHGKIRELRRTVARILALLASKRGKSADGKKEGKTASPEATAGAEGEKNRGGI